MADLEKLRDLEEYAQELGAYRAKLLAAADVVIDDRVRLKCHVPVCEDYNRHLLCPPHTIPVEKFKSLCSQYAAALLVQVKSSGYDKADLVAAEKDLHSVINKVEGRALTKGNYLATGYIASSCKLCPECVGYHSGEPCRHPYQARPSIESMGVDIFKTAENAGMGFNLGLSSEVVYCGLVLLD